MRRGGIKFLKKLENPAKKVGFFISITVLYNDSLIGFRKEVIKW
jgi:hypothetical protein